MTPPDDANPVAEPTTGPPESGDPLERLERNERSGRQAVTFLLSSLAAIAVVAGAAGLFGDVSGPECPEGPELCTTPGRVSVVVLPTLLALALSIIALRQTYRRWKFHIRWRPWLWVSQLMWLATTGYLVASSSLAFTHR